MGFNEPALLLKSSYKKPGILFNRHIETIYPALFRKVEGVNTIRERINTPDNDFLDLDWSRVGSKDLVIISHGLEGNSEKAYMRGMIKAVNLKLEKDALAWNYRGCSGEQNLTNRFYHSGATDDLELVVNHALSNGYQTVQLIGFSLGGNLTLKYLGEREKSNISGAVVFSVPLDLEESSNKLMEWFNYLYSKRFLNSLKSKFKQKNPPLPNAISASEIDNLKHVFHFDEVITAPLHGFKDAKHYYRECSSLFFLPDITDPVLIVNAKNDPFLSDTCFPYELLRDHPNVFFESPEKGGHCGFAEFKSAYFWSEHRAMEFLSKVP